MSSPRRMRQKLSVPFLQINFAGNQLDAVDAALLPLEKYQLQYTPWGAYPYKPEVLFTIAHSGDCILLTYRVKEKSIRAANGVTNSAVYEDSCVEFFLSFNNEREYYNLELNVAGTIMMAYGSGRNNRGYISDEKIKTIARQSVVTREANTSVVSWRITAMVPAEVFVHHNLSSLSGCHCKGNFYKCGDLLPEPHFVTWCTIHSPEPDFHLPEFFGDLLFE